VLPSSMRRMKLSLEIFPEPTSDFILSRMIAGLFSSTASSLKQGTMTDSLIIGHKGKERFDNLAIQ